MNKTNIIKILVSNIIFWFGLGVLIHDYAHQVWQLKGYHNIVEGGYIGMFLCIIGWIIFMWGWIQK